MGDLFPKMEIVRVGHPGAKDGKMLVRVETYAGEPVAYSYGYGRIYLNAEETEQARALLSERERYIDRHAARHEARQRGEEVPL